MRSSYTEDFKKNAVETLLRPGSGGLSVTSRKLNIPDTTLIGWKQTDGNISSMKKSKNKSNNDWTPEQKLEAIAKTYSMNENELGE